jgi:hypothetical protein
VLGTLVLAVLAGHWRYAHINSIRNDGMSDRRWTPYLGSRRVGVKSNCRMARCVAADI